MEMISVRCSGCGKGLKAPATKAGRKIQCSSCGTDVLVPRQEDKTRPSAAGPGPDDDKGGYGFLEEIAAEAEKATAKSAPKKKAHKIKRRLKTIQEPENWRKVRAGLGIVMVAIGFWAASFALNGAVVVLGLFAEPSYAAAGEKILIIENQPEPALGRGERINLPGFLVGLVAGYSFYAVAKTMLIIASVLVLAQAGVAIAGYSMCSPIPNRFGTRFQVTTLIILALVNIVLTLLFKVLPLTGVINYALVPWFAPEVCMIEAATDRVTPIHVFWSNSGFWEVLLTVLVMFVHYAEPMVLGVLMWSIGVFLREPPLEDSGFGVVQVTLGVAFTRLVYFLFSVTGTSPVLLIVLRVAYCLWCLFTVILLIRFVMALTNARATLTKYLDAAAENEGAPTNAERDDFPKEDEYDEEGQDDDADEEMPRGRRRNSSGDDEEDQPRRRRTRRPSDDDEDDDDDR